MLLEIFGGNFEDTLFQKNHIDDKLCACHGINNFLRATLG